MKRITLAEAGFWVCLGLLISLLAWKIGIGTFLDPGPGFFAVLAGLALVLIGGLMSLMRMTSSPRSEMRPRPSFSNPTRLGATVLLLLAYGFFMEPLGYILCTFFAVCGLFYDWGRNRFLPALGASAVTTGVTYLMFETWLKAQLPRGLFPWW